MKQILAILLCVVLFAGCNRPSVVAQSTATPTPEPTATATPTPTVAATPEAVIDAQPLTGLSGEVTGARPVAVMVNNDTAATRQWGTQGASVILEALTEGTQTNLALLYDSINAVPKVGPIAQGKDTFWQLAIAENAILVQNGWNLYAENLLNCYAYQPIDAQFNGVNAFDYDRSAPEIRDEFCWYAQGSTIQNGLASYGITTQGEASPLFSFGTTQLKEEGAQNVTIRYSNAASTSFAYAPETGNWNMFRADGSAQMDANTGAQVAVENVLLLAVPSGIKDDRYTRDYTFTTGTGLYLTEGRWLEITWQKGDVTAPLVLYTQDGTEVLLVNPGKTYIGIYGGFAGQSLAITGADGSVLADQTALAS